MGIRVRLEDISEIIDRLPVSRFTKWRLKGVARRGFLTVETYDDGHVVATRHMARCRIIRVYRLED